MKRLILLLVFLVGLSIISCEKCEEVEPYFRIVSLMPTNLQFTEQGSRPWVEVSEGDTIRWDEFFNRVEFNTDYVASKRFRGFSNSLHARTCPSPGDKGSKSGVADVRIVTLFDYDSQHFANDTINSLIEVNEWTLRAEDFMEFISIDEYIDLNASSIKVERFEFKLLAPPSQAFQAAQFKIIYDLVDGQIFEATTEELVFSQ